MTRISFLVVVALCACGKKDDNKAAGGGGAAKTSAGGGGKAAAVALKEVGLKAEIPGDILTNDKGMGEGASTMVTGTDIGAMTVEEVKEEKTVDAAKTDAKDYSPAKIDEEKLADGWAITFNNKGDMGENFFVETQRKIDGKLYKCGTTTNTAARQAVVLAACKSLKK